VDDDDRRIAPALVRIAETDAAAPDDRRCVRADGVLQHARELGGRQVPHRRLPRALGGGQQVADAGAVQRGNGHRPHEIEKRQAALELLADLPPVIEVQAVPLVDDDDECAAALDDQPQEAHVLLGDAFAGIEHGDHHLRPLHRLQRLDDAELLDRLVHSRAAPDPGGIDQNVRPPVALERHGHAVPGRARLVVDHQAILAQQAVHERGLADVGTAPRAHRP
jgi:hypothetical protein